jgi:hypothetical protein
MKKLLLLCVLLLCACVVPSVAFADPPCNDIATVPATITVPGIYCLSGSKAVNTTGGNTITIAASDVTVDCAGRTLHNLNTNPAGNAYAIYVTNRHNVHVKNCHITGGYAAGIVAYQNNALANQNYYMSFTDNFIAGPLWYGILAYGSAIDIRNNRIYDIGGRNAVDMGIRVAGSTVTGQSRFFLVQNNLVAGVSSPTQHAYGIYSDNSLAGIFSGNAVSGTTAQSDAYYSYGIRLGGSVNKATDNHIVGSGKANDVGILAEAADDACYDNHIRATLATVTCDASLGNY